MHKMRLIQNLVTNAPVLTHPDPEQQFMGDVDTSDSGVGGVLSQGIPTDQKMHPSAFFSRCLKPAERNYDVGMWENCWRWSWPYRSGGTGLEGAT